VTSTKAVEVSAPASPPAQAWKGRSLGGAWLFGTCVWLLRFVGVSGAWVGAWIVAAGFMILGGREQYGALRYWRRLRPRAGPLVHLLCAYRQYASFGRVLCDRMLVYLRPQDYRFSYRGVEHLHAALGSGKGFILLAAHVGNWELSGYRLRLVHPGPINLVMVRGDDGYVQRMSDEHMRGTSVRVIDPRDPLGASLAIYAALGRNEPVCMLGDRTHGQQAAVRAPFLGASAAFPIGPFHAAMLTGVPILVCFLVKDGLRQYRLEVDPPWHLPAAARGPTRTRELHVAVTRWAARLERQVRRHPLQWHNFFDFWV